MKSQVIATLTLAAAVVGQDCGFSYTNCLEANDQFVAGTCTGFQTTNSTLYSVCQCYGYVNRDLCFNQCQNGMNSTVLAYKASIEATMNSVCASVGLNSKALPQPAPWAINVATVATSTITSTATAIATPIQKSGASANAPLFLNSLIVIVTTLMMM